MATKVKAAYELKSCESSAATHGIARQRAECRERSAHAEA
jgi:hypothetical protein